MNPTGIMGIGIRPLIKPPIKVSGFLTQLIALPQECISKSYFAAGCPFNSGVLGSEFKAIFA
jgi:hypothetical protein